MDVQWLCGAIEGKLSHFLPCMLDQEGLAECDQPGKNSLKYYAALPLPGIEPGSWRGQTARYIHSPTELSQPGPQRGQTVGYIHSPTELS